MNIYMVSSGSYWGRRVAIIAAEDSGRATEIFRGFEKNNDLVSVVPVIGASYYGHEQVIVDQEFPT